MWGYVDYKAGGKEIVDAGYIKSRFVKPQQSVGRYGCDLQYQNWIYIHCSENTVYQDNENLK
jgi:hypothetical protein